MSDKTIEPVDSPTGWVNRHIQTYVDSNGEKGHRWNGLDTLLLTTHGRKSGKPRRTALIYGRSGDDYLVVASNGGSQEHPFWYQNLVAEPKVTLQVGAEVFAARARTATPSDKPWLWKIMAAIFPTYDRYQRLAKREIPVVILTRDA